MTIPRILRHGLLAALTALAAFSACSGHAQGADAYPDRPVTLVVPTAAAGGTDTIARLIAEALGRTLKQSFIVDNRPGANGILGTEQVARSAPDGYRLLFTYTAAMVVNPSLYRKLPYDPVKDLAPIAQIGRGGNLLLVRNDLPVNTLKEFVAYARAHPDKLSYCSWGNGSGGHLAMESLKKQAGLVMTHVPYKGSSLCVQDLMGGQVDAGFADMSSTVEIVRAGRLKALASSGPSRIPMLPDVPTMSEQGVKGVDMASWLGFYGPPRMPEPVVARLNAALVEVLAMPATRDFFRQGAYEAESSSPQALAALTRSTYDEWGDMIRKLGLTKQAQ